MCQSAGSVTRYKGGGGLNPGDIVSERDMITERHASPSIDDVLQVSAELTAEYGDNVLLDGFAIAELKDGSTAIAYYDGSKIAMNQEYLDANAMKSAYDACVASGFHPGYGKRTPTEAVAAHEYGHAMTDAVGKAMGVYGIDTVAKRIVEEARKGSKHRGIVQFASAISTYATQSNAEAVAEAFSDVFCNGKKAKSESRAIVDVMNKYLKKKK